VDLQKVIVSNPEQLSAASLVGIHGKLYMNFRPNSPFDFSITAMETDKLVEYTTVLPGATAVWYWRYREATMEESKDSGGEFFKLT
jgi:hypothetical protein